MNIAPPKTNIRRTLLAKLCFDFIVGILAIELRFGQKVAAEGFKNLLNLSFCAMPGEGVIGAALF